MVASMVLMDSPHLVAATDALRKLTLDGGMLVLTMTHPWFWPDYWEYRDESWFDYMDEIFIEAEFAISLGSSGHTTTHIHRPLDSYLRALSESGFQLDSIAELMPDTASAPLYPEPWRFPRFLGIVATAMT